MPDQSIGRLEEERIRYLFDRYMNHSCTSAEETELAELALLPANEPFILQLEQEYWEKEKAEEMTEEETERYLRKILNPGTTMIPRIGWRKIAVAASIILAIGLGSYFMFFNKQEKPTIAETTEKTSDVKAPETNRAMITLASGKRVYLDSVNDGQLAMEGNIKLVKLNNGQVAYETTAGEVMTEMKYNTLENPRGSKVIDMTLADGSRVWLNAGSSVKYPVAFLGQERKVEITGEAYFEVMHDASHPFFVSNRGVNVQVLGTHFNVNAYDDEAAIKVTLLEGAVKVSKGTNKAMLQPGQQAQVTDQISVAGKVNLEEVMAWKNGKFLFDKTDIRQVMRQIARWYNVDIRYEGEVKGFLNGGIDRKKNALEVLKMLSLTGEAKFEINENVIIVKP